MSLGAAPNLAVETELAPHATPPLGALGAVAEERRTVIAGGQVTERSSLEIDDRDVVPVTIEQSREERPDAAAADNDDLHPTSS